jgi:hypothetical protein
MNTVRREFQEAFIKRCFDHGLSEEVTTEAFEAVHLTELLNKSSAFRLGWDSVMNKSSWLDAGSTAGQVTSFLPRPQVSKNTASSLGGLAGAVLSNVGPMRKLKFMGGGLRTLLGAGGGYALGNHLGSDAADPKGPSMAAPYLPSMLGNNSSNNGNGSIFDVPGSGIQTGNSSRLSSPAPLQGAFDDLHHINSQLADTQAQAHQALQTPGLVGSSQNAMLQQRIADLQKQKAALLQGSNSFLGQMRSQQGRSLSSIDSALSEASAARSATEPRATAMDAWFRSHPNGGFWYQLFNRLTGAQGQASQMASQQQNLSQGMDRLRNVREDVTNMLQPMEQ